MEDLIGRKCKIHIRINNSDLFYTGTILSINSHSVTFCDRHDDIYLYNMANVVEINDEHKIIKKEFGGNKNV